MRIRTRIIGAALVVVAVANIAYTGYFLDRERRDARMRLQVTIEETGRLLGSVLAGPLYDGNVPQLTNDLESFFLNPDILRLELRENRGDISIVRERQSPAVSGEIVEKRVAIVRGIDELGEIRVVYTTANIEARLLQSRNELIGLSLISLLALAVVIYFVARGLTRPIDRLTAAARAMADGKLDQPIDPGGAQEMVVLGASFSRMRDAIRAQMADLAENNRRLSAEVAQRTAAEEQIRTLNATLEQRVQERTAELEATLRELEAFSYSVSHDLRAPLRAIDGFSRIILEDYADNLDADGRGYLERVRRAVQRMGTLIDELLDLSRVGRAEMQYERVDLSRLAREVIDQLRSAEPERSVTVTLAPELFASGDERLLRLVLQNLLGNAWKYTRHTPDARIEFDGWAHGRETIYRVRDNGAGFDMAYVNKLFRPFQRLHLADEFEGSGVGLATVARIVSRHGGCVWAEGEVGKGASFYFALPTEPVVS